MCHNLFIALHTSEQLWLRKMSTLNENKKYITSKKNYKGKMLEPKEEKLKRCIK